MRSSNRPRRYIPEAGDLVWTDFDPRVGREQSGRRPALVVSPSDFCRVTEFAIVCPITSRVRPFGTSVVLPPGLPVSGEILTSHVRSIDTLARPLSYSGATVPAATLDDVRSKLAALIGLQQNPVSEAVEKVEAHIVDAVKNGAKVVLGSKRAPQGGTFFEPTVLTDVTTDIVITTEEIFGPVGPLYRFKTDA